MNLVECWIEKVFSVEKVLLKSGNTWLKIDLIYNCCGGVRRDIHYATEEEWKKELEQGYYLG